MIPRILEYEEGRIIITPEAYMISEINAIIKKHENPEPYLAYVFLMSSPNSPFINLPEEGDERREDTIIYEVIQTIGEFDVDEELLSKAVDKMKSLYTSTLVRKYEAAKILHDKFTRYMRDKEITEGKDGNMTELMRILEKLGPEMKSFKDLEKQVDEELKTKMRGKSTLGEY